MIADNPTWTTAERYRRARLLAGMEQAELATALGVARATVSAWETGRTEPSMSNFVRIARLTGQPLDWFAAGVNDESPAEAGLSDVVRLEGLEPPTF
ncbi:helix-turn-helix transcriptional regulator [uncultured Microbacterium sp.]|uniref:helix-turn-helix transcriptional regulator n=1 Tax=uncultured Microbacterium sp. TaxID=191216 RepID=UPI0025F84D8B|nr:helix-turn-helix transcriptional regulator [uncultured Microbacterium sp.]